MREAVICTVNMLIAGSDVNVRSAWAFWYVKVSECVSAPKSGDFATKVDLSDTAET